MKPIKGEDMALMFMNLAWWCTDKQIEDILVPYGKVRRLRFVESKTNGKSKGICFAMYENPEDSLKAIKHLKDLQLEGKPISVSLTTSDQFEQLNTHNRGRKERREFVKKPTSNEFSGSQPSISNFSRGSSSSSFPGRSRGGFRGMRPPYRSSEGPGSSGPASGGEPDGYMPHSHSRGPRYPFPHFLPPGPMPGGFAPHINPAFFNKFAPPGDSREHREWQGREREHSRRERDRESSHRDREEHSHDRDRRDKNRRSRERERDKDKDKEHSSARERDEMRKDRDHVKRESDYVKRENESDNSKRNSSKRKREDEKDDKKIKREKHSHSTSSARSGNKL